MYFIVGGCYGIIIDEVQQRWFYENGGKKHYTF